MLAPWCTAHAPPTHCPSIPMFAPYTPIPVLPLRAQAPADRPLSGKTSELSQPIDGAHFSPLPKTLQQVACWVCWGPEGHLEGRGEGEAQGLTWKAPAIDLREGIQERPETVVE